MAFSTSTYQDRVRKASEVAASRGLAGLVLTRPSSVFYTAGFVHQPTSERPLYVILPTDGEPFLLTPKIEYDHAKSKSWLRDIRLWYFDLPSRERPFKSLAGMLRDAGMAGKTIGVEDDATIAALTKEMPGTILVNTREIIRDLRMVKSREEIDLMKKRAEYADFATKVVAESLREGVSELEIAGEAVRQTLSKMAKEVQQTDGSMPIDVKVVAGPRSAFLHAYNTLSKLKKGDVILVMVETRAYGYVCGIVERTFFFGTPTEEQKKIYEITLKGMNLTMDAMKPGARCSEVHRANYEHWIGSGYGEYLYIKTGILMGLEAGISSSARDDVYLYEVDETVLKPGMTFLVGSGIAIPSSAGYRLGDMILVTEKGCESLQNFPSDIRSVSIRP